MTALVYVGSLADDGGITVARRGPDGGLIRIGLVPGEAPSFLAAHPALPVLYAVHGTGEGTVAAYDVGPGGDLTRRAAFPTLGVEPCHLAVAPDGSALAVANYDDGTVSVRALDASGRPAPEATLLRFEGRGPHPDRQRGPHAHMCHYTPDGLLYVVDLGADRVHRFLPDLTPHPAGPVPMPPGRGPRHIAGDGRGHWYVAGELDGTVSGWAEEHDGWREVSALPATGPTRPDEPAGPDGSAGATAPDGLAPAQGGATAAERSPSGPAGAPPPEGHPPDAPPSADLPPGPAGIAPPWRPPAATGSGSAGANPDATRRPGSSSREAAIEAAVRDAVEAAVAALGAPVPGPEPDGDGADAEYPSHIASSPDGRLVYVADRGPDTIGVFRADAGRLTPLAEVTAGGRWPRHFALAGGYLYVANQNSGEVAVFVLRDGVPEHRGTALRVPAPACVLPWNGPLPSH